MPPGGHKRKAPLADADVNSPQPTKKPAKGESSPADKLAAKKFKYSEESTVREDISLSRIST